MGLGDGEEKPAHNNQHQEDKDSNYDLSSAAEPGHYFSPLSLSRSCLRAGSSMR